MNKAVLFDRDGILNKLVKRDGGSFSPRSFNDFSIYPSASEVTKISKASGYLNIVVSNQPDISRGFLDLKELKKMTEKLRKETTLDDVLYCTHSDFDNCKCRKPLSGLLNLAINKWKIDINQSIMIGDTWKDGEAAKKIKLKFLLLDKRYNKDYYCKNRINKLSHLINFI